MKKVIFSFLAICLFSSVGFATERLPDCSNEKEMVIVHNSTDTLKSIPKEWIAVLKECIQVYNEVKALYTEVIGEEQATATAQGAFVGCVGGLK
ncbi:hypothetical protein [Flavobacterium aurantiibacter]|uniref:Uncharacterized protein n=1 Tax=Flavobacterium aurantiibacter TaxID=2023067 RepID=A0A256AF39_9FLAO|nr:hypothetical protein [Flavobacterium aurantiibacter]OYQ51780.1 hypothetical protein CHX27_00165 [Flavobacterium aurantiibacter]